LKLALITKSMVLGYGIDEVVGVISKKISKLGHRVTVFTTWKDFPLKEVDVKTVRPLGFKSKFPYCQSSKRLRSGNNV